MLEHSLTCNLALWVTLLLVLLYTIAFSNYIDPFTVDTVVDQSSSEDSQVFRGIQSYVKMRSYQSDGKEFGIQLTSFECDYSLLMMFGIEKSVDSRDSTFCPLASLNCCDQSSMDEERKRMEEKIDEMDLSFERVYLVLSLVTESRFLNILARHNWSPTERKMNIENSGLHIDESEWLRQTGRATEMQTKLRWLQEKRRRVHVNFICFLCDAKNHQFFSLQRLESFLLISMAECRGFIQETVVLIELVKFFLIWIVPLTLELDNSAENEDFLEDTKLDFEKFIKNKEVEVAECNKKFGRYNDSCQSLCQRDVLSFRFEVNLVEVAIVFLKALYKAAFDSKWTPAPDKAESLWNEGLSQTVQFFDSKILGNHFKKLLLVFRDLGGVLTT